MHPDEPHTGGAAASDDIVVLDTEATGEAQAEPEVAAPEPAEPFLVPEALPHSRTVVPNGRVAGQQGSRSGALYGNGIGRGCTLSGPTAIP